MSRGALLSDHGCRPPAALLPPLLIPAVTAGDSSVKEALEMPLPTIWFLEVEATSVDSGCLPFSSFVNLRRTPTDLGSPSQDE
jgi:hypothetical protein